MIATAAFGQSKDDTPKINLGVVIFADYTYQESPEVQDADKNPVNVSSFNITRAYINVTGNLNHYLSFRITPDIARAGNDSALAGSQVFRLKYAYAQLNLDDWAPKGSWIRAGITQTPYIDYFETLYRYRFQGSVFPDRLGLLTASDAGVAAHVNFPANYGDLQAGVYNGEGYNHPEVNNQKALQLRLSIRPLPLGGIWKGLRVTGFVDDDHYVADARRYRAIEQVTFEHPRVNAGLDVLPSKDQVNVRAAELDGHGWSAWATPRLTNNGWEMLLRHDNFTPDRGDAAQKRNIAGIAYWLQGLQRVTSAVMVDYDSLSRAGAPNATNYGVKILISF